jgi:hypothetical protein
MEKLFVPYEIALAMKGLEFDEPCMMNHYGNDRLHVGRLYLPSSFGKGKNSEMHNDSLRDGDITAILYQQAFKWFREKCSIQATIEPTKDQHRFELGFNYWIWNTKTAEEWFTEPINRPSGDYVFDTYEEAELECLKKLVEIVKEKK